MLNIALYCRPVSAIQGPFSESVDQDQNVQNVQPALGSTFFNKRRIFIPEITSNWYTLAYLLLDEKLHVAFST